MSRNQKEYDPTSPMQLFVQLVLLAIAISFVATLIDSILFHPITIAPISLLILVFMLIKFFKSYHSKTLSKKLTKCNNSREIYQTLKEMEEWYEGSIEKTRKYFFIKRDDLKKQRKDAYSKFGYFAAISPNIKNFIDQLDDIDNSDDLYVVIKENEIIKSLKYYHSNKRIKLRSVFSFIGLFIFWSIWIVILMVFIDSSMKLLSIV